MFAVLITSAASTNKPSSTKINQTRTHKISHTTRGSSFRFKKKNRQEKETAVIFKNRRRKILEIFLKIAASTSTANLVADNNKDDRMF